MHIDNWEEIPQYFHGKLKIEKNHEALANQNNLLCTWNYRIPLFSLTEEVVTKLWVIQKLGSNSLKIIKL